MAEYNASSTRDIAKAKKASKQVEDERRLVVLNLMSSPAGRNYMLDKLTRCHIFATSFNPVGLVMAFAEGERNAGLQDLNDIMAYAPDQYVQMMREDSDRNQANGRRTDDSGLRGRRQNGNGADSGSESDPGVESEYEPGDEASS